MQYLLCICKLAYLNFQCMSVKLNMSVRMQWKNFCQDASEGSNSRIYSLITRACNSCYGKKLFMESGS